MEIKQQFIQVKSGVKITIHNRDMARGQYYHEDDWDISTIGENLDDAIARIVPQYVSSQVIAYGTSIVEVAFVTYGKSRIVVEEGDDIDKVGLIQKIESHPVYIVLRDELIKERNAAKQKEAEERELETRRKELDTLDKLKRKYEA